MVNIWSRQLGPGWGGVPGIVGDPDARKQSFIAVAGKRDPHVQGVWIRRRTRHHDPAFGRRYIRNGDVSSTSAVGANDDDVRRDGGTVRRGAVVIRQQSRPRSLDQFGRLPAVGRAVNAVGWVAINLS